MSKSNENLIKLSDNNKNYLSEWLVECKTKVANSDIERRCICCNQLLRINWEKNIIRNKINGNHAIMGSTCIKKFNETNYIKIRNDIKQIRENIITLFHEGIFNKILNLEDYVINVLFDYLRSENKNINIDYLKKMINKYANNEIIFDELCKILELKIEEKNRQEKEKEERIKQKEEEEERIKQKQIIQQKEEEERIKQKEKKYEEYEKQIKQKEEEEEEERIKQEEYEKQKQIIQQKEYEEKIKQQNLIIQQEEERKNQKKEYDLCNEKNYIGICNCTSISFKRHKIVMQPYYINKFDPEYKVCIECFNYFK